MELLLTFFKKKKYNNNNCDFFDSKCVGTDCDFDKIEMCCWPILRNKKFCCNVVV
jgi:hypothetical protein